MSFRFEQALDAAREAEGRAKILVTVSVNRDNGVIKCFTGTLCYSNKKQEEFISEETLSTSTGKPLQYCSSVITAKLQANDEEKLKTDALNEIDFSISNNLIESRVGLLRFSNEENKLHVIKFEERGSFLIAVEKPAKSNDSETLYSIAFTDVIADPISNSSTHF